MPSRHQRSKSDSHKPQPIPATSIGHASPCFKYCDAEIFPSKVKLSLGHCLQFQPADVEHYQNMLEECEKFSEVIAEHGLEDPILAGDHSPYTSPALAGHRTQSHYLHALRLLLAARKEIRDQSRAKTFWKAKAKEDIIHGNVITPSSSQLALFVESVQLDAKRQQAADTYFSQHSGIRNEESSNTITQKDFVTSTPHSRSHSMFDDELADQVEPCNRKSLNATVAMTASLERICNIFDASEEFTLVNATSRSRSDSIGSNFSWEAAPVETSSPLLKSKSRLPLVRPRRVSTSSPKMVKRSG